jgi:hypothetical protein
MKLARLDEPFTKIKKATKITKINRVLVILVTFVIGAWLR